MVKKRGLGRDLDALLDGSGGLITEVSSETENTPKGEFRKVPIGFLEKGKFQPRNNMNTEALEELAESIKSQGIIQPIVVREIDEACYEIIAGERRWRAAQLAGLAEAPILIRDISDESAIAMALIENIQRENLNSLEEAHALSRLIEEFHMTHDSVAKAVGKSRTTVTNLLRLLSLNADVKLLLSNGDLEMGHARALLSLNGQDQSEAARRVTEKGLSVRETEKLVKKWPLPDRHNKKIKTVMDANLRALQKNLSERLETKTLIKQDESGKGKIVIHYNNADELESISNMILYQEHIRH